MFAMFCFRHLHLLRLSVMLGDRVTSLQTFKYSQKTAGIKPKPGTFLWVGSSTPRPNLGI